MSGMTVQRGQRLRPAEGGHKEVYRGAEARRDPGAEAEAEVVVADEAEADAVVDAIVGAALDRPDRDGKVWVTPSSPVVRPHR